MRRLLLTDEAEEVLDHLTKELGSHFEICRCTTSDVLMEYVETFEPELMVLDLGLSKYDPLAFLAAIRHKNIQVIATNSYITDTLARELDVLGVRWLICKPFLGRVMAGRLLDLELQLDNPPDGTVRSTVYKILQELGIYLNRSAFRLLTEGIIFAVFNPGCALLDELYPYVAQQCNTSTSSVEINIRRGIEQAFRYRNPYNWKCVFGQMVQNCPTNGKFIKHIAAVIRLDLNME